MRSPAGVLRREWSAILGVAVFTAFALLLTLLIANTLRQSGGDRREYFADFTDASAINVGDEVRIAGVRVGRVESRELRGDVARIGFAVSSDQPVRTDTTARISYLNLLGQRYLALEPGAEPGRPLREGDVIGVDRTRPALDLTTLFNAFKPLFEALDPADVNLLAGQVVELLQGQGPTLSHLATQTAQLTHHLADRDEIVGRVIDNLTTVMASASQNADDITRIVDGLAALTDGLADDADRIEQSLTGVERLTTGVDGLLAAAQEPFPRSVLELREAGDVLVAHLDEINRTLPAIPTMLDAYARAMSYGSWLNIHICNLSFEIEGTPRVAGTAGLYSEVCR